ncbi:hypothetical protein RE9425_03630 [Prescottella equi]|nr:hypothetical protein RE9425_03630 [Prescottella equi]BCN71703.1 hypothetical protein RE0327_03020 [Prescottella equi]BCN81664.1 hypothetical protein RE0356_03050 [Prescottella equi]
MTEIECEGDVAFRAPDHRRWNPAVKPNQKVDKFRAVHSVQFHCHTGSIEMLSVNDLFAVILNLGLRVGSAGFQLNTSVENPV